MVHMLPAECGPGSFDRPYFNVIGDPVGPKQTVPDLSQK